MAPLAIETRQLVKRFGALAAVDGLDLQVETGVVYGLLGRNGAGKTTALRTLMGVLLPTAGSALVLGRDLRTADAAHRARVAYVPQVQQLPERLTIAQLGAVLACFYPRWDGALLESLMHRFELPRRRRPSALSTGQQRILSLALALACRPELLVLDEPAAGLDPVARRELLEALIELLADTEGTTVLLSTHLVGDLERLADVVGFLDRGRLLHSAPLDELRARLRKVQVIFRDGPPSPRPSLPGALRTETEGPVVTGVCWLRDEAALDELRGLPGAQVHVFPLGLEDIFIELVGARTREREGVPTELRP
jgi:ABC-2 type transport system ATP-binding protein